MKKFIYYLFHRPFYLVDAALRRWGRIIPNVPFLKIRFWLNMRYWLNLKKPQTFAEKLQWIKLYDHKPIYHKMVDKYEAKSFIESVIGEGHTIPTIAIYDNFEQIDWNKLPHQFVLKATHDSGSFYIVKDKDKVDKKICKKRLYTNWNKDYYYSGREWQYKGLKSRIIAEPLLVDSKAPYLRDFKFYCFNGEPKVFYITSDKGGDLPTRQDFFDINGNHINLEDKDYTNNPIKAPDLPDHLDEMLSFSKKLAKDTYHLRVDFYEINGTVYVGELTFHENAGFCSFKPDSWNLTLGSWIHLPIDK